MGFRYRKSIKIAPGIRLNVSSRGVGYSVGVPGYRVTKSASGRVSQTVSIPGTGLRSVKTLSGGQRASRQSQVPSYTTSEPAPGLFAPASEKAFFKARKKNDKSELARLSREKSEAQIVSTLLAVLAAVEENAYEPAREMLSRIWAGPENINNDKLFQKYLSGRGFLVSIAEGVTAELPLSGDAVGLIYAELLQAGGKLEAAIEVVEGLDPTQTTALSLADLYAQAGKFEDIIDVSTGIENVDDQTALLLVFRASAFLKMNQYVAARECLKEALKSKKRLPAVRHQGLIVRAMTYLAEGKRKQAMADAERLLAENPAYPGLDAIMKAIQDESASRTEEASGDADEIEAISENPARWEIDPTGKHQMRYWDGEEWTSYVADDGVQSEDPL